MDSLVKKAADVHKDKVKHCFINWRVSIETGSKQLADPRLVIEHLLKSIVFVKHGYFNSPDFVNASPERKKYLIEQFDRNMSIKDCSIYLEDKYPSLMPVSPHNIKIDIRNIQSPSNKYIHGLLVADTQNMKKIEEQLCNVLDWYYRTEKVDNWERTLITPEVYKVVGGMAYRAAKQALEEHQEKLELRTSQIEEKDNSIIKITSEYWDNLLEKWKIRREHVYENFLLKADENYTHSFIALESQVNSNFSDEFTNRLFTIKRNRSEYELTFDNLLQEACATNTYILVKLFAPSGGGKTVFLGKMAYRYSQANKPLYNVIYLEGLKENTMNYIKDMIVNSNLPTLLLIDTPSKYELILKTGLESINKSILGKPFIVIIADQIDRYKKTMLNPGDDDFEDFFSEIYQVDYDLSNDSRSGFLKLFKESLSVKYPDIDLANLEKIYLKYPKLTTRERIRQTFKELSIEINLTPYKEDWEIYENIVSKQAFSKYENLFAFVALFTHLGIPVPVSLFDCDYLYGLKKLDIIKFLDSDKQNIIRITVDDTLKLRHEQVPKWYFETIKHKQIGRVLLETFLIKFSEFYDRVGCILYRKIHKNGRKTFLKDMLDREKEKTTLKLFIERVQNREDYRIDVQKVMMELCTLEYDDNNKHFWLEKIIANNLKEDIYARKKKVNLYIKAKEYEVAIAIIEDIKQIPFGLEEAIKLEQKLRKAQGIDLDIINYFKDHPQKITILYSAARREMKNGNITKADQILKYLGIEVPDLKAKMIFALYFSKNYQEDRAISILKEIVQSNPADIPAPLLLHTIYFKLKNYDEAEDVLIKSIENTYDQPAPYVILSKMYRNPLYEIKVGIEAYKKAETLFKKGKDMPFFEKSKQYRTEYAKWCYEKHPDDEDKQREAVSILKGTISSIEQNHQYSRTELGIIYQRSKFLCDLNLSVEILEEAVSLDIDNQEVACRVVLAKTYQKIGTPISWNRAKELLENAEKIDKENLQTYLNLLLVYQYFNLHDDLKRVLDAIENLDEKHTGVYITLSENYLKDNNIELALKTIENKLVDEPNNPALLIQAAKILLHNASIIIQKGVFNDTNKPHIVNNLLERALNYLNQSYSSPRNLNLQIHIYDSFLYDRRIQKKEYLEKASLRNKKIIEFNNLDPDNKYLRMILCLLFNKFNSPRLAMAFLNLHNYSKYSFEEKIEVLTRRKAILVKFNARKNIDALDEEFLHINTPERNINNKLIKGYNNIRFIPRENYELIDIYNQGIINLNFNSITCDGHSYPIVMKYRPHNKVKPLSKVYFAKYLINNKIFANDFEPYFDESDLTNLNDLLPYKLNLLQW